MKHINLSRVPRLIVRPTNMAEAFMQAAIHSIRGSGKGIEAASHDPKIPWVARRIAVSQDKCGLIAEPSSKHNLVPRAEK